MSCISFVIRIPVICYSYSCYFHCYISCSALSVFCHSLETTGNVMSIKLKSSGCLKVYELFCDLTIVDALVIATSLVGVIPFLF